MSRLEEFQSFGKEQPKFATARELVKRSIPMDLGTEQVGNHIYRLPEGEHDSVEAVMERKYKSAKDAGIAEDIRKRGIIKPIRMLSDGGRAPKEVYDEHKSEGKEIEHRKVPLIYNGQHRVAVMFHESPDTPIPLEWNDPKGNWDNPRSNANYNTKIPPTPKQKK